MTLAAARVTLKQHRFEVGAGFLAALVAGISALVVVYRLNSLEVPFSCIDGWLGRADGPEGAGPCAALMRPWTSVLYEEGNRILEAMRVLPFAVGLLAGVPIVAHELEARTAQTAWSLEGSRVRWLVRQVAPILLVLGVAVGFAAVAIAILDTYKVASGDFAFFDLGLYGPLLVLRAFCAFGVGLMIGALLGRTLPASVLGAALALALALAVGAARDRWLWALPAVPIATVSADRNAEPQMLPRMLSTDWGYLTPDGRMISNEEGLALVPPEIAANDSPVQPVASDEWLSGRGYTLLPLGVSDEMALAWAPYEALIFGLVGSLSIATTIVVVDRRRPT
jgi:hypothetical protein